MKNTHKHDSALCGQEHCAIRNDGLYAWMRENGITTRMICKALGVTKQCVGNWRNHPEQHPIPDNKIDHLCDKLYRIGTQGLKGKVK